MIRIRRLATVSLTLMLAALSAAAAPPIDDTAAEVARLREQVKTLESILQGTAGPINLARTSLATVDASSVNGSRTINNQFYGALNAFDDGDNWLDSINYTYWLASGEASPWIEVRFDHPVTVHSIVTETALPFTTRLGLGQGGEIDLPRSQGQCTPAELVHGVTSVRLTFDGGGNVQVNEIRILGHVPPTVAWVTGTPRVHLTDQLITGIATEAFAQWQSTLAYGIDHTIEESAEHLIVTFRHGDVDLVRVTVRKSDLQVETETLAAFAPIDRQRDSDH